MHVPDRPSHTLILHKRSKKVLSKNRQKVLVVNDGKQLDNMGPQEKMNGLQAHTCSVVTLDTALK